MKSDYIIATKLIGNAGLSGSPNIGSNVWVPDDLPTLTERIRRILKIVSTSETKPGYMICFIMYDISSNKVRGIIAKFLQNRGCTRVQKSIFMASLPADTVKDIINKLTEIQQMYANDDSILIVPLSDDYARAMKIIGQEVNIDLILHDKNTLFF